jgi:hypothetical protein
MSTKQIGALAGAKIKLGKYPGVPSVVIKFCPHPLEISAKVFSSLSNINRPLLATVSRFVHAHRNVIVIRFFVVLWFIKALVFFDNLRKSCAKIGIKSRDAVSVKSFSRQALSRVGFWFLW